MALLTKLFSFDGFSFINTTTLLLALFFLTKLILQQWNKRHYYSKGSIKSTPSIGSAINLSKHQERLHDYLADCCKKYTTFKVSYPTYDFFYTADPRNVEYMLKTNFPNYIKGKFSYENMEELFGDGIFSVDGAAWMQQRKVASFEFSSRILRDFSESAFRDYASKLANLFVHEAKANRPVQLQDAVMRMTLDSVCKLSFGVDMSNLSAESHSSSHQEFAKAFDGSSNTIFWRFIDPFWKIKRWLRLGTEAQLVKDIATINKVVYGVLEDRKKEMSQTGKPSDAKPDLLSRFLALSKDDPHNFTDNKIRDIVLNFMLAGRDTTSVTMCWFFYMLIKNPHVEKKVVQEILNIVKDQEDLQGESDDDGLPSELMIRNFAELLTYERLSKLHYLHACFAETLRLYPAVPLDSRAAAGDDVLPDGTVLRKGDVLGYHAYGMGRMESIWGPDAKDFKPERFLKEDGTFRAESPFKHVAFHAGPRMCLGKDFAYLQMKVTAAVLLRFLKFEALPSLRVNYRLMITLNQEGLSVKSLPRCIS